MGVYYLMMFLSFGLVAAIALGGHAIIALTDKRSARGAPVGGLVDTAPYAEPSSIKTTSSGVGGGGGFRSIAGAPGGEFGMGFKFTQKRD